MERQLEEATSNEEQLGKLHGKAKARLAELERQLLEQEEEAAALKESHGKSRASLQD